MSPIKEPHFFCFEGQRNVHPGSVTDVETYRRLFKDASNEVALGEASPGYILMPEAIERIKHYIPHARLIAILRNPVDRAHSHYVHMVRTGSEPCSAFAQAIREEQTHLNQERVYQGYIVRGFYYEQLRRYFDSFHREQLRIYLHEDLNNAPIDTVQDSFRFLGVKASFVPDVSLKRNISGYPKSKILELALRPGRAKHALKMYLPTGLHRRLSEVHDNLKTRNLDKPPPLEPEVRQQLISVYREDILKLQELIDRDLSGWIK